MVDDADTGGSPEALVGCTACDRTYPAQRTPDGRYRPIGTDGSCACGNDAFDALTDG